MVKTQVGWRIEDDLLSRFRTICNTRGVDMSGQVEYFISDYLQKWDGTLSSLVPGTNLETVKVCKCGHPTCTLFDHCIYCGRTYTFSREVHNRKVEQKDGDCKVEGF
jgi:hypothetical protein